MLCLFLFFLLLSQTLYTIVSPHESMTSSATRTVEYMSYRIVSLDRGIFTKEKLFRKWGNTVENGKKQFHFAEYSMFLIYIRVTKMSQLNLHLEHLPRDSLALVHILQNSDC